jgi:hypothetical protein
MFNICDVKYNYMLFKFITESNNDKIGVFLDLDQNNTQPILVC